MAYTSCRRIVSGTVVLSLLGAVFLTGGCSTPNIPSLDWKEHQRSLGRVSRLGTGDKVRIIVYGESELSGTFSVDARGQISFPLIGAIRAKGLTVNQFRRRLRTQLANGYLSEPKISAEIASYRPMFLHGEVRNGGEYAYRVGIRLQDAIAVAGGFTYRADDSFVLLTREGQHGPVRVNTKDNIIILPGDNIRVTERFF